MAEEFACPELPKTNRSFIRMHKEERGRVLCRSCGAFLGTLTQFRRFVLRRTTLSGTLSSGCPWQALAVGFRRRAVDFSDRALLWHPRRRHPHRAPKIRSPLVVAAQGRVE